jgi:hypothetical protein
MKLDMILSQADVVAALQNWVALPTGGSVGGVTHQMNATVSPVLGGDGSITVVLNF